MLSNLALSLYQSIFSISSYGYFVFIVLKPFLYHQGLNLSKPLNPYDLLGSQISSSRENAFETSKAWNNTLDKCDVTSIGLEKSESVFKSVIRKYLTINDIQKWTQTLKRILRK